MLPIYYHDSRDYYDRKTNPLACFHPRASFQPSFSTVRLSLLCLSFYLSLPSFLRTTHPFLFPSFHACLLALSCTFPPSSFPPDTFGADRPRLFLRFFVLFSVRRRAILINALTLPLHNYLRPSRATRGSNNTISQVYRELRVLETAPPRAVARHCALSV